MDKNYIIVQCFVIVFVMGGGMLCIGFSPSEFIEGYSTFHDTLKHPDEITIVSGTDTLFLERTTLQNVIYYKRFDRGGFDIKYVNENGEILEMNIRHYCSLDAENGNLTIYL